jgi:uncharacterized oxidoreductase
VIISGRRRANLAEVVAANPGMVAIELDITEPANINAVVTRLIADANSTSSSTTPASCCQTRQLAGSMTS